MCFMALMFYILLICVIDLFLNKILKKSYDGLNYIRKIAIPSNRVNKSKPLRMTSKIYSDVNYKQKMKYSTLVLPIRPSIIPPRVRS